MNHIHIHTEALTCIECRQELTRSIVHWFGHTEIVGAQRYRDWAHRLHLPLREDSVTRSGLCDRCYDGRSDEDIRLIKRLGVYSRNVKNIENESFKQNGAEEKHTHYHVLLRTEIVRWIPRFVFMPSVVPDQNRTFYMQEYFSQDHLEDWLEP